MNIDRIVKWAMNKLIFLETGGTIPAVLNWLPEYRFVIHELYEVITLIDKVIHLIRIHGYFTNVHYEFARVVEPELPQTNLGKKAYDDIVTCLFLQTQNLP